MENLESMKQAVRQGHLVTREEALALYHAPLNDLCQAADEIRQYFCGDGFDMCTIVNGKSGRCSENCRFCAQSSYNHTGAKEYSLLSTDELVEDAKRQASKGVLRYSIVTSGRRLNNEEVSAMCEAVQRIRKETDLAVCASFGLLDEAQFRALKAAGVSRIHNNLEASKRFFKEVCTTHTHDDKIAAIHAAQAAGLSVCSGGIMGLGETVEDRVDMALSLRALGIKSVPVNMLNPIPGTPFAERPLLTMDDMRRIVAVYRFILPDASIRLAGGRGLLPDRGRSCFASGANAAISGDMLTTAGITVETDRQLLQELGYTLRLGPE